MAAIINIFELVTWCHSFTFWGHSGSYLCIVTSPGRCCPYQFPGNGRQGRSDGIPGPLWGYSLGKPVWYFTADFTADFTAVRVYTTETKLWLLGCW